MKWINFLHLYQPANTDAHIIKEATEESYLRIVRGLEEHPNIKFTLNISGCLFLRWEEMGYGELIDRIGRLIKKGQIDLTGTAAYHPLLPLIPVQEVERQIDENEKILQKHFGKNFKPRGFFFPEMAYSKEVAKIIKAKGYDWIILDEISCNGKLGNVNFEKAYLDTNSDLKVVFRSREFSKCYVPEFLRGEIKKNKKGLYITATDGELYGLRHQDPTAEFEKLLKEKDLKTQTISEFVDDAGDLEKTKVVASNWESLEKELKNNIPYALWFDKKNKLQMKLWKFANSVYEIIEKYPDDDNYNWARWHLVRGFASCAFWWASARDFRLFGPPSWSPDEIERGVNEFIRAVRALDDVTTRKTKIKTEKLYINIKHDIWTRHWKYYWKR